MLSMAVGELANFVAYAYAPAIIVTPLGALSVIVAAILAHYMLKERLNTFGALGCALCIVGSINIVMHAPPDQPFTSITQVRPSQLPFPHSCPCKLPLPAPPACTFACIRNHHTLPYMRLAPHLLVPVSSAASIPAPASICTEPDPQHSCITCVSTSPTLLAFVRHNPFKSLEDLICGLHGQLHLLRVRATPEAPTFPTYPTHTAKHKQYAVFMQHNRRSCSQAGGVLGWRTAALGTSHV